MVRFPKDLFGWMLILALFVASVGIACSSGGDDDDDDSSTSDDDDDDDDDADDDDDDSDDDDDDDASLDCVDGLSQVYACDVSDISGMSGSQVDANALCEDGESRYTCAANCGSSFAACDEAVTCTESCFGSDSDDDDDDDDDTTDVNCSEGMADVYDCDYVVTEDKEDVTEGEAVGLCIDGNKKAECFAVCGEINESDCDAMGDCFEKECL